MELLLQHPEKTIAEMLDGVYEETGSSLLFETKVVKNNVIFKESI